MKEAILIANLIEVAIPAIIILIAVVSKIIPKPYNPED